MEEAPSYEYDNETGERIMTPRQKLEARIGFLLRGLLVVALVYGLWRGW